MNIKNKWFAAAAIIIVIVSSSLVAYFYSSGPDPAKMTSDQIAKYIQSEDFNSLSHEQRRDFMHQAMDSRVNTYYSLPPDERTKYLDKVIDDMAALRRQGPPPQMRDRMRDPNSLRNRFQNASAADRRARRETRDPEQSFRQRQFFQAMRTRMGQRGMQMPRFGPGGGGGPR
ncbi:MAG: hypothetical protein A2Y07_11895 [Planctomycetes bacterium GWF2_50_10]|nr:MAG: hypothetical protein A2Y07_11895 [Planctomycetes bacterium GWF2_50_10]